MPRNKSYYSYSRSNVVTRGPAIWKERRHDPFEFHEHFYTDSFA